MHEYIKLKFQIKEKIYKPKRKQKVMYFGLDRVTLIEINVQLYKTINYWYL